MLTRDQILSAQDLNVEEVEVKEWGGKIRLRCLTGKEREDLAQLFVEAQQKKQSIVPFYKERLLIMSIVDQNNDNIFKESDIEALSNKNPIVLQRLFDVAQKLSGLAEAELEEVKKN